MVTIDQLASAIIRFAGKRLTLRHVPGPTGVRGRSSQNDFARSRPGWAPNAPLERGLERTYRWIAGQVEARSRSRNDATASSAPLGSGVSR